MRSTPTTQARLTSLTQHKPCTHFNYILHSLTAVRSVCYAGSLSFGEFAHFMRYLSRGMVPCRNLYPLVTGACIQSLFSCRVPFVVSRRRGGGRLPIISRHSASSSPPVSAAAFQPARLPAVATSLRPHPLSVPAATAATFESPPLSQDWLCHWAGAQQPLTQIRDTRAWPHLTGSMPSSICDRSRRRTHGHHGSHGSGTRRRSTRTRRSRTHRAWHRP